MELFKLIRGLSDEQLERLLPKVKKTLGMIQFSIVIMGLTKLVNEVIAETHEESEEG